MSHKSVVCNNHRNTDHLQLNYLKALIAGEKAISSTEVMHRQRPHSPALKLLLSRMIYWIIRLLNSRFRTRFMPIG